MSKTQESTLPELVERFHAGQIPANVKVRIIFEDNVPSSEHSDEHSSAALFAEWAKEDAQMTPEEQAENERIYAEIEKNGISRVQI